MQDRFSQNDENSCDARPDHTFGSKLTGPAPANPRQMNTRYLSDLRNIANGECGPCVTSAVMSTGGAQLYER